MGSSSAAKKAWRTRRHGSKKRKRPLKKREIDVQTPRQEWNNMPLPEYLRKGEFGLSQKPDLKKNVELLRKAGYSVRILSKPDRAFSGGRKIKFKIIRKRKFK